MEYKTKEYVVAFIDILGASKKIKNECDKSLNIVHQVYNNALLSCDKLYNTENIFKLRPIVKIYSDNIVLAVPTDESNIFSSFLSIVILSGLIQNEFLHHKYLVRGGISIGNFFVDDIMIWGNALLDAYYIESNVAIYPRIVIHPNIIEKLHLAINPSHTKWIRQDADGLFFVDYMQEKVFKNDFLKLLICRIQECEELSLEVLDDIKSQQKILWHNTYLLSKLNCYDPKHCDALKHEVERLSSTINGVNGN